MQGVPTSHWHILQGSADDIQGPQESVVFFFGGGEAKLRSFIISRQILLQQAIVQKPQKGGGKSIHFLKALFITNINVSRLWLWRYLKYSAIKFRTSKCYTNSLKMNVFFHLSVGLAKILFMGLSDQYKSFLKRFFISLMVEELFSLNQENPYVMFN